MSNKPASSKEVPRTVISQRRSKPEILEIIIDTCSIGQKQLYAVDSIIERVMSAEPRIYADYHIVIPMQIATESNQRIFPEFLRAHLSRPAHPRIEAEGEEPRYRLREFYQKHAGHVQVVESEVSIAYKMMYAARTMSILHSQPDKARTKLENKIISEAKELTELYKDTITEHAACSEKEFGRFRDKIEKSVAIHKQAFEKSHDRIRQIINEKNQGGVEKIGRTRKRDLVDSALRTNLSRHGAVLDTLSLSERFFLQAMYSNDTLNQLLSKDQEFKRFRLDKGEREIDAYLFSARSKRDPNVATLVVSQDQGARESIQELRAETSNKVIVVSNKGLLKVAEHLAQSTTPVAQQKQEPQSSHHAKQRRREAEAKAKAGHDETAPNKAPAKLDKLSEGQWEAHLLELLRTGDWQGRVKEAPKARTSRRHH